MKPYSAQYSAVKMREYRARDPEKHREYLRQYRRMHPEKCRLWDRKQRLEKRYGLSPAAVDKMRELQHGLCACCGRATKRGGKESVSECVDHDHASGKVRAILCKGCNVAIAHLGEDPRRCELAAEYLRKHKP